MKLWNSKTRSIVIASHDLFLCGAAWLCAFYLRHNLSVVPETELSLAIKMMPLLTLVQFGFFFYFKTYRALWRYSSVGDLANLIKSVLFATVSLVVILMLTRGFVDLPRSVLILYPIGAVAIMSASRLFVRMYREKQRKTHSEIKAIIVGAGSAGERLLRDFIRKTDHPHHIVGFVDDDTYKRGQYIHGVLVLGALAELPDLISNYQVEKIFIAIPSATSKQMRRVIELCKQSSVEINTLPSIKDIVSGKVSVDNLKGVSIEDLLGRVESCTDFSEVSTAIHGKTVLVTGAGGSIGAELSRQLTQLPAKKIILLDHSEYNLYAIQQELSHLKHIQYCLGSIDDNIFITDVFEKNKVDVVFHAAAYKHVPMLENQVRAAIKNNVIGTNCLVEKSISFHVEKFILISTDKAVNPSNIMGATKRAAEKICQYYHERSDVDFSIVRFGNVLGSQGSVLPLFKKQLSIGGPLTVTDKSITRYFMSIPEAASLILQSSVLQGNTFVLDMGEPVSISYLAEQLIRLSGKRPYEDIDIVFTGLRPGEKMYEELFYQSEDVQQTRIPKIMTSSNEQVHTSIPSLMLNIDSALEVNDTALLIELLNHLAEVQIKGVQKESSVLNLECA